MPIVCKYGSQNAANLMLKDVMKGGVKMIACYFVLKNRSDISRCVSEPTEPEPTCRRRPRGAGVGRHPAD